MASSKLKTLENEGELKNLLPTQLTLLFFSAKWSEECNATRSLLKDITLDSEFNELNVIEIESERFPVVCQKFHISCVPTLLYCRGTTPIEKVAGLNLPQLVEKTRFHNMSRVQSLNDRLKQLINSSKVMVFMKGTPDQPRCGFSGTLMTILNETRVAFQTFDIMEDDEVRQGLKAYSNWQTYPQVYVDGELVGGLDIIKELRTSGELVATLEGS